MRDPDEEDDDRGLGYPAPFVSAGDGMSERAYWGAESGEEE